MLVEDTMSMYNPFLAASHQEDTEEQRARSYTIIFLCGKLRSVVQ